MLCRTRMRGRTFATIISFAAVTCGCGSAFKESHFLKSVDGKGHTVNYYRVTVSGGTILSSSRYISGYFDEQAVNTYFNEFVQPASAHFDGTTPATPGTNDPQAGGAKLVPIDSSQQGTKLVLLLSSNSDEIANGINSLAQSGDVSTTLQKIIGRTADASQASQAATASESKALRSLGESVTALSDPAAAKTALLSYANRLASFLEPGRTFTSLDDAAKWVKENANRLEEK